VTLSLERLVHMGWKTAYQYTEDGTNPSSAFTIIAYSHYNFSTKPKMKVIRAVCLIKTHYGTYFIVNALRFTDKISRNNFKKHYIDKKNIPYINNDDMRKLEALDTIINLSGGY